jgi:anti-anti-sigma factor
MDPMATTMEGGELTAAISGEFDMAATFTVEPALERALEEPELRGLTLDLSNVTFIDSTGIGVVLWLAGELDARELAMRIVPGPPEVQRVFESVGIAEVLPFQTA